MCFFITSLVTLRFMPNIQIIKPILSFPKTTLYFSYWAISDEQHTRRCMNTWHLTSSSCCSWIQIFIELTNLRWYISMPRSQSWTSRCWVESKFPDLIFVRSTIGNSHSTFNSTNNLDCVCVYKVFFLTFKGIVHNLFSLLKSHILGYDGVWYSSFWSEGSGNHLNWQNLVQKFVPRGSNSRRN